MIAVELEQKLMALGLKPAVQQRSRETRLRLLMAARALATATDFTSLAVEEICREARCSIGAFYNHFPTKDILLEATVTWMCLTVKSDIDRSCRDSADQDLLQQLIAQTVGNYRDNQRFLRSVIHVAIDNRKVWQPIQSLGQYLVNSYLSRLATPLPAEREHRIRFGFQAMFGLLNNELVNAPGPFTFDDPALQGHLHDIIMGGPAEA